MLNFCTLFDKNYLYKGLALYNSLKVHCPDFKLWILCMDNETLELIQKLNLDSIQTISLSEFETKDLLRVKSERNRAEYSWTCTANLCRYLLTNKKVDAVTYLDADLMFFDDPAPLFEEIDGYSIAIIEHRFPKGQEKYEKTVGRFNVGFVYFKNDQNGLACVNWWADRVIEWCYDRVENGRFGDQMYLNDWPERFKGVLIIKSKRIGSAPWNIKDTDTSLPIFYHFHAFKLLADDKFIEAKGYFIPAKKRQLLYVPYEKEIKRAITEIRRIDPSFHAGYTKADLREKFWHFLYNDLLPERLIFWLTKIKHRFNEK